MLFTDAQGTDTHEVEGLTTRTELRETEGGEKKQMSKLDAYTLLGGGGVQNMLDR